MNRIVGLAAAALLLSVSALGVAIFALGGRGAQAATTIPLGERTFYLTGLEYKGATSTRDLAAPEVDPTTIGDGYRYKQPGDADKNDPTRWEVSTYRWEPGVMQVLQGDRVTLVGFIVNGDHHKTWVEDPSGAAVVKEQEWHRGREYKVSFVADKAGYYIIHCDEHDPSMTAYIIALPR